MPGFIQNALSAARTMGTKLKGVVTGTKPVAAATHTPGAAAGTAARAPGAATAHPPGTAGGVAHTPGAAATGPTTHSPITSYNGVKWTPTGAAPPPKSSAVFKQKPTTPPPKHFLKTKTGMATMGVGAATVVGGGAYAATRPKSYDHT